jgi:hypothetical protein
MDMELTQGQQLGHYRIDAKIGQGGMGSVYRATDSRLDREVAIKVRVASRCAAWFAMSRWTLRARSTSGSASPPGWRERTAKVCCTAT